LLTLFAFSYCFRDICKHGFNVGADTFVGESENVQPALSENILPFRVAFGLELVDASVHFDNDAGGMAIKIRDKPVDNLLSPEVMPSTLITPQSLPQQRLSVRHITPHCLRYLALFGGFSSYNDASFFYWNFSFNVTEPHYEPGRRMLAGDVLSPFPFRELGRGG
jgi:hypothetical protein